MSETGGPSVLGWIGRFTLVRLAYVVDLTTFISQALWQGRRLLRWGNRATRRSLIAQIIFSGVDALPIVTVLALAIGLTVTTQILSLGEALGSTEDIVRLLTNLIGMELGSLLTAIVLIGRSGSAIAVDLGNMQLHGETEGLEVLGVDIGDLFITPRVLGAAVAQIILAAYFYFIALFGGVLLSGLLFNPADLAYLQPLAHTFELSAAGAYALKNMLFGLIIGGTACFHALRVRRSPTEVPQQTQNAIVNGLLLVFVLDGLFAIALTLHG